MRGPGQDSLTRRRCTWMLSASTCRRFLSFVVLPSHSFQPHFLSGPAKPLFRSQSTPRAFADPGKAMAGPHPGNGKPCHAVAKECRYPFGPLRRSGKPLPAPETFSLQNRLCPRVGPPAILWQEETCAETRARRDGRMPSGGATYARKEPHISAIHNYAEFSELSD